MRLLQLILFRKECLLYLGNDGLEGFGIVHGEVGEHLAVDLATGLVQGTHQRRAAHAFETSGSIDTLYLPSPEGAVLVAAVAMIVSKTLFPGVLC